MATSVAIVAGAQRVSIASARLDAVGEALATRVSGVTPTARGLRPGSTRAPPRPRGCHAGRTRAPSRSCGPPRTRAPPTMGIVSARAVKRWGPPLNVWSRFASFPRCASRLH